ncbi:RAMP superfamily CRISPR-associated protein [Nocardiopsis xinjiangensis]|uniref:RAMP superfamily CRISPR-associated protein n=1 Tax=Nocardiopsis xinjiangensis TaxID=124285 RepID=UPI00034DB34E|nr:RAMP superfamily CRISPR-associated protein [Nocardiopsis xinjiangensis]
MSETPTSVLWEVTARLVLLSDTHIGPAGPAHRRADEPGTDLPVDRDPDTGLPRLRATTLAGLLRHDLTARTGDTGAADLLFGTAAADDPDGIAHPGTLDLDDIEGRVPAPVVSRAGNRVDPASGTALPGHLWNREILPAGTVLAAHLRLHVPAPEEEKQLLGLLVEALAGLHGSGPEHARGPGPGLHVGARTGRGHGSVAATAWGTRRHDLTTAEGWFAYHARTWAQRHEDGEHTLADGPATLTEALARGLPTSAPACLARDLPNGTTDRRHRDELRLMLAVGEPEQPLAPGRVRPGLLMVTDLPPPERAGAVDRVHRYRPVARSEETTAGSGGPGPAPGGPVDPPVASGPLSGTPEPEPVLGDTALHALLKRIAARLARDACEALGGHEDLWRHWHAHWWGGDTDPATALPRPCRVRLRRTPVLTGGAPLTTTRLTVDSLFGDAVDGHLSTSDVHCGGTAEAVLDVHEPDDTVRGLFALLVRELATVPTETLGSGAGNGHGRITATAATLTLHPGHDGPARTVDLLHAVRDPDSTDARTARAWVSRWHARLGPRPVEEGDR